ncbi:hypothetical protein [Nocardia brasiliensis]|uniref:hypothetical protein n=1 Tax=Nocardia brasiliensis TaxID=37326 RepID=UPI003671E1CF
MVTTKNAAILIATGTFVSMVSLSAEAQAGEWQTYTCDNAVATHVGTKVVRGNKYSFSQELPVFNVVAADCKPSKGAPAEGVNTKGTMVTILASTSEIVDKNGKTIKEGRLISECQETDAGDGQGLVTGSKCTAVRSSF